MEKRFQAIEVRASRGSGGEMTIRGYAATYGTLSSDLGGFRERIKPGAFERFFVATQTLCSC